MLWSFCVPWCVHWPCSSPQASSDRPHPPSSTLGHRSLITEVPQGQGGKSWRLGPGLGSPANQMLQAIGEACKLHRECQSDCCTTRSLSPQTFCMPQTFFQNCLPWAKVSRSLGRRGGPSGPRPETKYSPTAQWVHVHPTHGMLEWLLHSHQCPAAQILQVQNHLPAVSALEEGECGHGQARALGGLSGCPHDTCPQPLRAQCAKHEECRSRCCLKARKFSPARCVRRSGVLALCLPPVSPDLCVCRDHAWLQAGTVMGGGWH